MNTQQLSLFSLLCATSFVTMHAMERQPITFDSAQKNLQISWNILSKHPQYQAYKQAEIAQEKNKTNYTGIMLNIERQRMYNTQEAQNVIIWYMFIQNFKKTRKRSESLPTHLYRHTKKAC